MQRHARKVMKICDALAIDLPMLITQDTKEDDLIKFVFVQLRMDCNTTYF